MPMNWFRYYSGALNDPKVQRLKPALFKTWVNLLCLANAQPQRGWLPSTSEIAYSLRISEHQAVQAVEDLGAAGLLDVTSEGIRAHNWKKWQWASDARDTEGRKRHDLATKSPRVGGESAAKVRRVGGVRSDPDQNRTETDTEQNISPRLPLIMIFERGFGRPLSPMEIESIQALEEEQPYERIEYAVRQAAELNKRSVRYVQRTCEGIEADGGDTSGGRAGSVEPATPESPYAGREGHQGGRIVVDG